MTMKVVGLAADLRPRGRWTPDPLRDGFVVAGVVYVVLILLGVVGGGPDGIAYWTNRLPDPYVDAAYGNEAGFYYAPAIAQVLAPLTLLSWPAFHALLVVANLGALYWMLGRWAVVALAFPPVLIELYSANVNLLIAAAIVAGFRYPGTWALPLLTKVAPGIGLLWFAARRDWRRLGIALATTGLIVAVSFALAPDLWFEWVAILTGNAGMALPTLALPVPLVLRLPVALAVILWGALTDRRWTVPVAVTLAMPILWPAQLSILLAAIPLRAPGVLDRLGPRR